MAISLKEYKKATYKAKGKNIEIPNLYQSIQPHKSKGVKYLARFSFEGSIKTKILGFSIKDNLTPRSANLLFEAYKRDMEAGYTSSSHISLNRLFELYYESLKDTNWKTIKKGIYLRYIQKPLGSKRIESIKPMQINKIINTMDKQGLKPRTQKTILEVLKPMFHFAMANKMVKENPSNNINVKIPNQKKIVTGATELFEQVYQAITSLYKNSPFYQAMFLFGFTGRRKGEILSLKWENIDFTNNYYWIEDTKNDDKQKYPLAPYIKTQLLKILDDKRGLVFKSPINGKQMKNIDRQMRNLIKHLAFKHCKDNPLYQAYTILKSIDKTESYIYTLGWDDRLNKDIKDMLKNYTGDKKGYIFKNLIKEKYDKLSPHYMRNILVSMLAEQNTEAIILSRVLGNKDIIHSNTS